MKICLLDNTSFKYSFLDKYSPILRGGETTLINLSNALSKLGHEVTVFNNCDKNQIFNEVKWVNINNNNYNNEIVYDLAIANGNPQFFAKVKSLKKVLLSYSLQNIEKFIRKNHFYSYFKYRPKIVFLSDYHKKQTTKLTSLFGHIRLNLAVDDIFINFKINNKIDNSQSIFTSRHDRNLDLLLDIWNKYIYPNYNKGKLLITKPYKKISMKNNIYYREMGSQQKMMENLSSSRIFLVPGHKAELFCLAAAEAKELCIPIVTLGVGCLSERVDHEKTGFVAKTDKQFADFVIELYKNNKLWLELRNNLLSNRGIYRWDQVAKNLLLKI